MWDADHNSFQTVYKDYDGKNYFAVANTIQNLFPLLLSDLPQDKIDMIVAQLKDTSKFNAPYSIPTGSKCLSINYLQLMLMIASDLITDKSGFGRSSILRITAGGSDVARAGVGIHKLVYS